jgi:hypothetical protein
VGSDGSTAKRWSPLASSLLKWAPLSSLPWRGILPLASCRTVQSIKTFVK